MESQNDKLQTEKNHPLIGMIGIFTEWRRFLIICVFMSIVASTIVAFLMTPEFKSMASVLPADQADLFGSMDGISSIAKAFSPAKGLAALRGSADLEKYLAILKSGRVLTKVIHEFDLIKVYKITSYPMEKATKQLLSNVEFSIENEGYLSVSVYDEDPVRAAQMANFFIDELNRTNSELQAQNAKANRKFIEERYKKNLQDLAASEDSLKYFQKKFGVIAMPEQTEASIKAGAALASELALKEVRLGIETRTLSGDHPSLKSAQIEVEELKKKLIAMNRSTGDLSGEMKLLVPFASIPDLGAEYVRRLREVEIQYKILQFLTPLFEQSKVEEQRQTPSVIVLDRANPAERKSRPKRLFIILGGMLVGILTAVTYVGVCSWWKHEQMENSNLYQAMSGLRNALSKDIKAMMHRKSTRVSDEP
jgi:tyrosine-protein kinase Etk/Wzc